MRGFRFRRLPHVADCRLLVWGNDPETLVANAVEGTLRQALGCPFKRAEPEWLPLTSWPPDLARQLVSAVNEALFLLYSRGLVTLSFRVSGGRGWLATVPLRGRAIVREIKAATFHSLEPVRRHGRIRVTLTLDL
jgi:SHS2 domain-containing protein